MTRSKDSKLEPISNIIALPEAKSLDITTYLSINDAKLKKAIDKVGGFNLTKNTEKEMFGALVRSIIYQQLNGRAASTIYERFKAHFDKKNCPSPEEISQAKDEDLQACGISRPKLNAIRSLCEHHLGGHLPSKKEALSMSDDQIVDNLIVVKGVGVWTAQMLLIFYFGRPDVLPYSDFGVRKGYQQVFAPQQEMPDRAILEKRAKRWKPYRSVASWYLWRVQDA